MRVWILLGNRIRVIDTFISIYFLNVSCNNRKIRFFFLPRKRKKNIYPVQQWQSLLVSWNDTKKLHRSSSKKVIAFPQIPLLTSVRYYYYYYLGVIVHPAQMCLPRKEIGYKLVLPTTELRGNYIFFVSFSIISSTHTRIYLSLFCLLLLGQFIYEEFKCKILFDL